MCGDGGQRPDAYALARAAANLLHPHHHEFRFGQDSFGVRQKHLARAGQGDMRSVAIEKRQPQVALEFLNLQAHGRLGAVEMFGSAAEMPLAGHGGEAFQLSESHAWALLCSAISAATSRIRSSWPLTARLRPSSTRMSRGSSRYFLAAFCACNKKVE